MYVEDERSKFNKYQTCGLMVLEKNVKQLQMLDVNQDIWNDNISVLGKINFIEFMGKGCEAVKILMQQLLMPFHTSTWKMLHIYC